MLQNQTAPYDSPPKSNTSTKKMPKTRGQQHRQVSPARDPSLSFEIDDVNMSSLFDDDVDSSDLRATLQQRLLLLHTQMKIIKKKLRMLDDGVVLKEAKRMYYHAHKMHPDLIAKVRADVGDANLPRNKKGHVMIPHGLLRKVTDETFDALTNESKDLLLNKAKESITVRMKNLMV